MHSVLSRREEVRVEWGDCDPARIVFYPRYFAWVDSTGHHMFESVGLSHDVLNGKYNVRGLVLGKVGMTFKAPGFFRDLLTINIRVTEIGGASFALTHEIHRGDTLLLTGEELRIWAVEDPDHPAGISAKRIPDDVRALLSGST